MCFIMKLFILFLIMCNFNITCLSEFAGSPQLDTGTLLMYIWIDLFVNDEISKFFYILIYFALVCFRFIQTKLTVLDHYWKNDVVPRQKKWHSIYIDCAFYCGYLLQWCSMHKFMQCIQLCILSCWENSIVHRQSMDCESIRECHCGGLTFGKDKVQGILDSLSE